MKAVIFSDVHLSITEAGKERMAVFTSFLRSINPSETRLVIVLGDLFDFWFEYKHVVFSGYFDVLRAFAALHDQGVQFHFICGNHDLWAGRFLAENLGFHIHTDTALLDIGGRRVLLVHGDGMNPRDVSYRIYKWIARTRLVVALFRMLHPDWAMGLAQTLSHASRRLSHAEDITKGSEVEPLRCFARDALAQGKADVVMCGHCHCPTSEAYPTPSGTGLYINTGDWLYHQSYVVWDGSTFRIASFPAASGHVSRHETAQADCKREQ